MALVMMTQEEYTKFCNGIANKYIFGLIICGTIAVFGFTAFVYIEAPLTSYVILAIGSGISVINLGYGAIHWKRCSKT